MHADRLLKINVFYFVYLKVGRCVNLAALTDATKGLKRISEGMTYGEVVTMFPITRAAFERSGIVEKENLFYVPLSCFVDAYGISIDELNEVVTKIEEKRPACTVTVDGKVLNDQMTFSQILKAYPRVKGIFETYDIYKTGKRNWQNETLASVAVAVKITPKKLLSNIASCIKAPFFPLGNALVLTIASLAFGLTFSMWILMGPLSSIIKTQWNLSYTANSVLIALPILMGSVMRVPMSMLTEKYGGRIVMSCLLLGSSLIAASAYFVQNYALLLVVGFFYGMCGTSFAVGIAQVTRWYPARKQGLALAIFGTGNVGTVLAALFAAKITKSWFGGDWHPTFPVYALPLFIMSFVYFFTVRNAPVPMAAKKIGDQLKVFKYGMVWILCLLYVVTFGYFVTFSLYLAPFYKFSFELTPVAAGYMAAIFCFIASVFRPLGGWTSDKFGAVYTLYVVYIVIGICLVTSTVFNFTGYKSIAPTTIVFACMGFFFGVGNGAVFKLIPQFFPIKTGAVGGIVGCMGGLGGYFLPMILGGMKDAIGHDGGGFGILTAVTFVCLALCFKKSVRQPVCIE